MRGELVARLHFFGNIILILLTSFFQEIFMLFISQLEKILDTSSYRGALLPFQLAGRKAYRQIAFDL